MCIVSMTITGKFVDSVYSFKSTEQCTKTGMEGMCIKRQWLHCNNTVISVPQYWLMHSFVRRPLWWWHITLPSIKVLWELTKQNKKIPEQDSQTHNYNYLNIAEMWETRQHFHCEKDLTVLTIKYYSWKTNFWVNNWMQACNFAKKSLIVEWNTEILYINNLYLLSVIKRNKQKNNKMDKNINMKLRHPNIITKLPEKILNSYRNYACLLINTPLCILHAGYHNPCATK